MPWQIIDTGPQPPEVIMQKDADLLANLGSDPILHLYEWEGNCLTYGYFMDPLKYLYLPALERYQILMARRPTGGGLIFHLTDYAFSILIPATHPSFSLNTLDNYAYINQKVIRAIQDLCPSSLSLSEKGCCGNVFCMATPTQYDIVAQGKKIGGAAQRRTKKGYLHQGSIALTLPPAEMLKAVLKEEAMLDAMQRHTYPLFTNRTELKQRLIQTFLKEE